MAGKRKGFGFSIGLDITDFEKSCKNLNRQIDQLLGANVVKMSNAAAGALAGVASVVSAIGVAAYKFGSQMDAMKTALEGTWGSAKKATEQYSKLQNIVENSNYNMSQLMSLDKTMKALGYDTDNSAKAIERLVNVGTANPNASLQSLADALLQIKTTGTVSARTLKQFADAGIEVSDLAGKDATTAINTLMERMTKFNGYMQNEATDIWSQIPRAVKIVQDALAELGNYLNDKFKGYVIDVVDAISNMRDRFKTFLSDENGVRKAVQIFKEFGIALTAVATPAIIKFGISMAPVALKVMAVTAAVLALTEALHDAFSEDSQLSKIVGNFFEWIYFKIKQYISEFKVSFFKLIATLEGRFGNDNEALRLMTEAELESRKMESASTSAKIAWNGMTKAAEKFASNSITGKVVDSIQAMLEPMNKFSDTLNNGGNSGPLFRNSSGDGRPSSGSDSSDRGKKVKGDAFGSMFAYYYDVVKYEGQQLGNELGDWFNKGLEAYNKKIAKENAWKEYKINMVANLADGFNEVLYASGNFFQNMGEMLKNLGKQILAQISQFLILRSLFGAFGMKGVDMTQFSPIASFAKINDGIVQNGKVVTTHPDDYIIATKDPSSLGGNGGVIVNVNNNTSAQVSTNSYFDGTKEIIDIMIDGISRNVSGSKDFLKAAI